MEYTTAVQNTQNCDKMDIPDGYILLRKDVLQQEHDDLLRRVQKLRAQLGYKPLPTGKQLRKMAQA